MTSCKKSACVIWLRLPSPSPFSFATRLGDEALHRQFDVLRNSWQKAAFITRDGVASHTESRSEFALRKTEEEPSLAKLPAGQPAVRLPEGALSVNCSQ